MLGVARKTPEVDEKLDELRALVTEGEDEVAPRKKTDRRSMLKMAGAALLGAAGAVAVRAVPAAAADGGNMLIGCTNLETSTTNLAGAATNGQDALAARGGIGVHGDGNASTVAGEIGVLGTSKSGAGIGVRGSVTSGVGVDGVVTTGTGVQGSATTGTAAKFHTNSLSTSGYDVQLGSVNPATGSGRLGMVGRSDVGGASPNWNPSFFIVSSTVGPVNFQHELVRGNDGSIWASQAVSVRSGIPSHGRWKRINSVRTDTADGLGANFKPFRVIDTRITGGIKAPSSLTVVSVANTGSGNSHVPFNAVAVMGNLTAVGYSGAGFLSIMPGGIVVGTGAGQFNPAADPSSLNFILGQAAIANSFVCGLNGSGQVQVYVGLASTYFIIDITAYLQ